MKIFKLPPDLPIGLGLLFVWFGLICVSIVLFVSGNDAQAEQVRNSRIDKSGIMVDKFDMGTGVDDLTRYYDPDTGVVCYSIHHNNLSCSAPVYDAIRQISNERKALDAQRKELESKLER